MFLLCDVLSEENCLAAVRRGAMGLGPSSTVRERGAQGEAGAAGSDLKKATGSVRGCTSSHRHKHSV